MKSSDYYKDFAQQIEQARREATQLADQYERERLRAVKALVEATEAQKALWHYAQEGNWIRDDDLEIWDGNDDAAGIARRALAGVEGQPMDEREKKQALADALRRYPHFGDAYLDALDVTNDVWGSLLAFNTDIPEAEVERLIARCANLRTGVEGPNPPAKEQT